MVKAPGPVFQTPRMSAHGRRKLCSALVQYEPLSNLSCPRWTA